MIHQKVRRVGNSYVVTIPKGEIERHGLKEGDLVGLELTPMEVRPAIRREVREAFEASWKRNEEAYRNLGSH
jgi:putative addiction module antidote